MQEELEATIDLTSAAFVANPYATYDHLRSSSPVWFSTQLGMWLATDYTSVERILVDARRFGKVEPGTPSPTDTERERSASLLDLDAPDHTRLRALVAPAFAPAALAEWATTITGLVEELLESLSERSEQTDAPIDLVTDYALPLAIRVISRILGLERDDEGRLLDLTHRYVRGLDVTQPASVRADGEQAHAGLIEYFYGQIELVRADPGRAQGSLMRELIEAREGDALLSSAELVSLCTLLLFGGYETTFSMIASGVRLILERSELAQAVRKGEVHLRRLTAEILRYESPVQRLGYYVLEDCELGGSSLRRGDMILACVGAANRDPQIFSQPDVFDITRSSDKQHMALGKGMHYCVGGPLAVLEGTIAIPAFIAAFPSSTLAEPEPAWAPTSSHRRPLRLLVTTR